MSRVRRRSVLLCLGVALLAAGCGAERDSRPNVLLISIDTLRADRLGCYGHAEATTPHIDALARAGIRFDAAISPVPLTLPSHASLLTGLEPASHGAHHNGLFRLGPEHETLAERLEPEGYATAAFVGAYVLDARYGLDQGFEVYDDDVNPEGVIASGGRYNERTADAVTDAAIAWIARRNAEGDTRPFLAWVHYFDPHGPYEPPAAFRRGEEPGEAYDGEIAFVDSEFGRLLDALGDSLDDTVVVLTADHGEGLGDHGEWTHGDLIYDSTVRVPLIVRLPDEPDGGRVVDDRVAALIDVVPTVLARLGIDARDVDGVDLLAAPIAERAIRVETLAPFLDYGWAPLHGLRRLRDKLILAPTPEYYALEDDPGETVNRFTDSDAARTLMADLRERLRDGPSLEAITQRALALDDDAAERLAGLGYLGSRGEALKDPKEMMSLWHRLNLAARISLQGEHERAIELIGSVVEEDPGSAKAWATASSILERAGDMQRAEASMRRAVALRPRSEWWVTLARYALGRGDRAAFERALDEAERLDPDNADVALGRGHGLATAGRLEEARRAFERAAEMDPVRVGPLARQELERLGRVEGSRGD